MCGPWLLPLALLAGGTGAKFIGAKQAESAQNSTFDAERRRQDAFTAQQQGAFEDSLSKARELADPLADARAGAARQNSLAAAVVPAASTGSYLPGSSSAPSVVADAQAAGGARSDATSSNLARTLAALGGHGDELQRVSTGIGRNHQTIGQIGSFKSGSAEVLDAEMKAAAQKGAFLRGIGSLAQQIGMMAIPGMGGAGAGASKAATGAAGAGAAGARVSTGLPGMFGNGAFNLNPLPL